MKKTRGFDVMTKCLDKSNNTIAALKYFDNSMNEDDHLLLRIFSAESTTENGSYIQPTCLTLEGKQVVELYNFLDHYFSTRDMEEASIIEEDS
ncbi:hypothetical protein ASZ90_020239 [hydrocarbon metagenome]|uniref:Uncharacterized protein n=1 Tax=hydrocarbon metagenome TaxID=938273 RepID=A0A0W8E1V6_9ZZZZ